MFHMGGKRIQRNPRILCQGDIHGLAMLCMSNVGQSIHGIHGYFAKGVSMGWPYFVCPMLVRVSMVVKRVSMDWVLCLSNGG